MSRQSRDALENVASTLSPNIPNRMSASRLFLFLILVMKNKGQNAMRKNPRDVGLSKRN